MIEIFRRPQHHTKANIQYNFIIQKTFKVCILSCQRASVPFSTGPGGKELIRSGPNIKSSIESLLEGQKPLINTETSLTL